MEFAIEKSGTGIEKSGTGIEKSGTGIEKSGTGIEKAGTGIGFGGSATRTSFWLIALLLTAWISAANADEPMLLLSQHADEVRVSVHTDQGIFAGSVATVPGQTFVRIDLRDALGAPSGGKFNPTCDSSGLMTHGAGTGSVQPCGSSGLMTHGAGTGSVQPCGSPGLMTHGSGTGSVQPCASQRQRWGQAEIVFDPEGIFVLINQDTPKGAIEVLADFRAVSDITPQFSSSDTNKQSNRSLTQY